ncbi:hypothetical protein MPRG_65480 [Mycobacterium paragordonae]|uniref:ANTAR domain-containing protein n=1 Tax=Mycobacterium paragordonae TaxID=1389713 RepID=A0ABQ1CG16_9MYCO|nr:hypothetical protein MPRG_65480 [Mycobacterium paragordonae]
MPVNGFGDVIGLQDRVSVAIHHYLGILARKRNATLDAHVRQAEAMVEEAVGVLRLELPEPNQFGP